MKKRKRRLTVARLRKKTSVTAGTLDKIAHDIYCQYSEIGRQRERSGGGKTFGIPRRRRLAINGNEGRDNKSPAPQYHNTS